MLKFTVGAFYTSGTSSLFLTVVAKGLLPGGKPVSADLYIPKNRVFLDASSNTLTLLHEPFINEVALRLGRKLAAEYSYLVSAKDLLKGKASIGVRWWWYDEDDLPQEEDEP